MKGLKGKRTSPGNHGGQAGYGVFTPRLDLFAPQHRRFDNLMNDTAHKKRMAKVTLPVITIKEPKD